MQWYSCARYKAPGPLVIVCAVIFWGKTIVLWTKIAKNWENVINCIISSIKRNIKENTYKVYWKKYTSMQLSYGVKKWFFYNKIWQKYVKYYKMKTWTFFSSPEPKARVSYCHSAPSVVRPSVVVVVRPSGVNFSHYRLLLQNRLIDFDETW